LIKRAEPGVDTPAQERSSCMAEPRASARRPLSSLASKIILFVFASTLATALVVSWISLRATQDSLRDTIARFYPISLEQTARAISSWLLETQAEVDALAALAGRPENARGELDRAVATSRRLAGWLRVDASGRLAASAGLQVAGAPRCAPAGALPRQCSIDLAPGHTGPGLATAAPGGALFVALLDEGELSNLLAASLPEVESTGLLLDARDRVLAFTGDARSAERTTRSSARLPRSPRIAEYEVEGRRMIGSRRDLGAWRVLIETPFEVAYAPVLSVVTRIFVGDLLVILLSSLLAYRVTATVVRPIERLSNWARRIAEGQRDLEPPVLPSRDEIGLLARTFNDILRQVRRKETESEQAKSALVDRNARLQQANEVLNQLSITDGLTRLHNHRFFQDHLTREIKRVTRSGEPLSMLLTDIDDFKQLNDRFGHAAGDELLTRIAQILVDCVRDSDLVARYGGEEFVILAINCDLSAAEQLAEKVRTAIAESSFILDDSLRPQRVTVSVGVATFRGNRKRFFQRADEALYRAKSQGKNCVVVEEERARGGASDAS
jgi:diguanylate cyclase (GGDEF)-like protein